MDNVTPHPALKNEFRDEIRDPYAGIPEDELVTRDQAVLLKELSFRILAKKEDIAHLGRAIENGKALRMELLALPKSPCREECLRDLDTFIANNEKNITAFQPVRSMLVTLLALEELFEKPGESAEQAVQIGTDASGANIDDEEDDLTINEDNPEEAI